MGVWWDIKNKKEENVETNAQEAKMITEKKIADDKRRKEKLKEERRQKAEKWAQKKFPGKMKYVLAQIKESAEQGEDYANISLTAINENLREVSLARLVVKELQKLSYSVYYKEYDSIRGIKVINDYNTSNKVREYYASWGPKPAWMSDLIAVK